MKKIEKESFEMSEKHEIDDDSKLIYRGWKVMPYIIGNETFEKLGAIGTLLNLLVYLTTVFNLNNVTATNIINIFNGSTNVATLLGAFVSDTYFGRYNTLGFCIITYFLKRRRKMGSSDFSWKLPDHPKLPKGKTIAVVVLDGWGEANPNEYNCIHIAETPTMDSLKKGAPEHWRLVRAHGKAVGLPTEDDMGNSEVGHNALGAGRIFAQG
ncbi:hypothetical protein RYX36_016985, partial [Vicia faba]